MQRQENLEAFQEYKAVPKRKPKRKDQGLRCYGFLLDDGAFDCNKFAYGDYTRILGSTISGEKRPDYFVNAKKEADWISVSTFKNSSLGRTEENISHILCCFLDLDGPYVSELDGEKVGIPLTDDIIRQRCYLLGLPMPLIIETSPGRYHIKFYFKNPVPISKKEYFKAVQRLLHEAFKDMGPDPAVTTDLTRFLRNENQENSVNKKYPNKPKVIVREKGQLCTLSEVHQILKGHGYTQYKAQDTKRPRRARQVPFRISQHRMIAFVQTNNGIITTHKEFFRACNVSESTGYLLLKGLKIKRITTETVRVGRTWKTKFSLSVHTLRKEVFTTPPSNTGIKKRILDVVRRVSRVGFPAGMRNEGAFMITLGLKSCGFDDDNEILDHFAPAFALCEYAGAHRFSEREMKRTVKSALKKKYRYCNVFAFKKEGRREKWNAFLKELTNLECELLRNIESGGEMCSLNC